MKLYIAENNKLIKYKLPIKVEESFLFPYRHSKNKYEYLINIVSNNGKWYFKNDASVSIDNGQATQQAVELADYSHYVLKFKDVEEPGFIFAAPNEELGSRRLSFTSKDNIIIGSDQSCNICYRDEFTAPHHASFVYSNDAWYIASSKDENCRVYLNNKRILSEKLKIGDIIFINGLKIVWMGTFIKINNPANKVTISGNIYDTQEPETEDNAKFANDLGNDSNLELYKDDDYFFHRPRLRTILEDEHVEIDAPPPNQFTEDVPLIFQFGTGLTMVFSSIMTVYAGINDVQKGAKEFKDIIPNIILATAMLVFSFLLPKILRILKNKQKKKREALRQTKYSQYLKGKEDEINAIIRRQGQILHENYVSLQDCANIIFNNKRKVWERSVTDEDFLTVRLGLGNTQPKLKIEAPEEHFTLDDDNLLENVYTVVEQAKEIKNVPITISYVENKVSALVTECSFAQDFINGIILQLVTYHSSNDLKIVFLTNKENESKWEYIKSLPHCWNGDKSIRYFATNLEEMKTVIADLEKTFNERKIIQADRSSKNESGEELEKNDVYRNFLPYYLIITDDFKTAKQLQFLNVLLGIKENYGYSMLLLEKSMQNLPNVCNTFTYVMDSLSCIFEKELSRSKQHNFTAEYNPTIDMKLASKELANIPIAAAGSLAVLPQSISFLEMYNVGKIEQLNILNRWKTSNPIATLQVPIGVHANGDLFKLDLHEKFHGPHGLIAGSTGSGKSEFIITYLLSLAVNYHPYEVQFVLIDYKGGGLTGAFENRETGLCVPHLAGTITNLDTAEMNRTLVSIQSELKRRQQIFNEVRDSLGESTIDIYKYQRLYREGVIKEPVSHLFIVSDEFAELKSQQPEFLNQLVSTARIGRSLGVHLILATQKPAGVVNDQIWSNSKFRVCLKVQTRQDSMDMLKRPEAASIKETGRFYLQVGYDELFEMGQSGWAGAKYVPTEKITKKIDDSITFINNNGYVVKSTNNIVKQDNTENHGEQLTNIVKYLADLAKKENLNIKKLWLESIPEFIYISNLKIKYKHTTQSFLINPIIGEYDVPSKQKQNVLKLDLTNDGNVVIYGAAGAGKENLLTTLIISTTIEHRPEEINFYILDFGAETLKKFQNIPHVGDVMFSDEEEKINSLVNILASEVERRKDLFAEYSGSYLNYIKESGQTLPQIVTIINSFEAFLETYSRLEDRLGSLLRDGPKYGISFIFTTTVTNGIRMRMTQYFTRKLVLQMPQESDYRTLLNAPKTLFPAKKFGRGITKIDEDGLVEFQTAYICDPELIGKTTKEIVNKLKESYPNSKAAKIPIMPNIVLTSMFKEEVPTLTKFPIGIRKATFGTCLYNFEKPIITPIILNSMEDSFGFIRGLMEQFARVTDVNKYIIDFSKTLEPYKYDMNYYNQNYKEVIELMKNNIASENPTKNIYIINGIGSYKVKFGPDDKKMFEDNLANVVSSKNNYVIIIEEANAYKSIEMEPWFRNTIDKLNGIWVGDGINNQLSIKLNMSLDEKKIMFPYIAYAVTKGKHMILKHMIDKEDIEDEE